MTNIFIQKIDNNKKNYILEKYNFNYNGIAKEYKINNVYILFTKNKHIYFKQKEYIKNDFIIYNRTIINPFNFYKIHEENTYKEYILDNYKNNKIILKEYNSCIILEYEINKNVNFNNEFLIQI